MINPSVCASVCLFVCLSVCPRAYLWNSWTDRHKILCANPLWLWLGPPPAELCTSGFMNGITFGRNGRDVEIWRLTHAVQLLWTACQHRDKVWCLWMPVIIIIIIKSYVEYSANKKRKCCRSLSRCALCYFVVFLPHCAWHLLLLLFVGTSQISLRIVEHHLDA